MGRSLKKGPFVDTHLLEKVEVMTGRAAVKAGVGGEVLCNIW